MKTIETTYDVFLTHDQADAGIAALVTREFELAGCGVFSQQALEPGDDFRKHLLDALLDSTAVVVLLTRSSIRSSFIAIEVGAALAWDRPVFVLYDGVTTEEVPSYLQQFKVIPLSKVREVVDTIKSLRRPMSDEQRDVLCEVYGEMRMPVDQLLFDPRRLRSLADEYRLRASVMVTGERLARELIRLRKQGKLPRIVDRPDVPAAT